MPRPWRCPAEAFWHDRAQNELAKRLGEEAVGKGKGGGVRHGREQTGMRRRDGDKSHWEEQLEGQEEEPAAKCC